MEANPERTQVVAVVEPKKYPIRSKYLQEKPTSIFLDDEELFVAATAAEVHLYDAVTLEKLYAFVIKDVEAHEGPLTIKRFQKGKITLLALLFKSSELLQLKLVREVPDTPEDPT